MGLVGQTIIWSPKIHRKFFCTADDHMITNWCLFHDHMIICPTRPQKKTLKKVKLITFLPIMASFLKRWRSSPTLQNPSISIISTRPYAFETAQRNITNWWALIWAKPVLVSSCVLLKCILRSLVYRLTLICEWDRVAFLFKT